MSVQIAPISESLSQFLAQNAYDKIAVLVDEHTNKHCFPLIASLLPKGSIKIQIKSGEEHKTIATCEKVWEALTRANMDRHGLMINLGGGVIGDLGGFCASTYKRGIDFIQIPTTLLAQVDASVGGKLGIDFHGLKNHIGVFQLPKTVLIDPAFIQSLPERQQRSGFAEIIKHCLIRDGHMWDQISHLSFEEADLAKLIAHSVAIKQAVVEEDPKEKGLRKILNFGHTLGHAIETYGRVVLKEDEIPAILKITAQDKKNKGSEIRFSLLTGLGDCGYDIPVTTSEMKKAIQYYMN